MSSSTPRNATPGPSSGGPAPSGGPNNGTSDGPQTGEKRTAADRESPVNEPSPTKKGRRGGKAKAKPKQYQLKRNQIPDGLKGTEDSAFLHGYILYGLARSDVPPPLPTAALLDAFEQRYEPGYLQNLRDTLRATSSKQTGAGKMVQLLRARAEKDRQDGSIIAKNILCVEERFLLSIFSAVLAAGLEQWCPDLMSPPDSAYNEAHRIVFIHSFKSVAASFAYRDLEPTPSGVNNDTFLADVFHSFAWSYMREKAKKETKVPGKLVQEKEDNNVSRRRERLSEKRIEFGISDKLPARILKTSKDPHAHSDDESGSDGEGNHVFLINAKISRSASVTSAIHKLEDKRLKFSQTKGRRQHNIHEHTRLRVADPIDSDISFHIPKSATVDYFEPSYFNDLPATVRYDLSKNGVGWPLLQHHNNVDWKTMDKAAFMAKYGNEVLTKYNIPTKEEMEGAGNSGWDEEEVEDMMAED